MFSRINETTKGSPHSKRKTSSPKKLAKTTVVPPSSTPRTMTQETSPEAKFWLDRLSPTLQFSILALGVFTFFGMHNLLQEAMMNIPGFTFGVMLGYLEVLGVTVCSFVERKFIAQETGRVAPLSAYPLLTGCLMASSSLSNMALNYINFPTKVVFRSCKLIPTMVVASIVNRKIFSSVEYLLALCISFGLVLFAAADWELRPSFHPIGLAFVSMSVCADAILPNAQERLFRLGSSRLEVTFFTNVFTLMAMTVTTIISGDFFGLIAFSRTSHKACIYMTVYTFIAYVAISLHMNVVKRFGGVAAVLLATGRKGMTLVLSFILFPKEFSWFYVVGAILVLGGLLVSSLLKIQAKQAMKRKQSTDLLEESQSLLKDLENGDSGELQVPSPRDPHGSVSHRVEMKDRNGVHPQHEEQDETSHGKLHHHQS